MVRRIKNKVCMLKNDAGEWVEDQLSLKRMAVDYYRELYSAVNSVKDPPLYGCFPRIEPHVLDGLASNVTDQEIQYAVFSIGAFKVPSLGELNGVFFHSQWEIVKSLVKKYVHSVFEDPKNVEEVNQTMIVMIPKVDDLENVKQFKPISLCNVIYKVVSKILANRLKGVMGDLVAPNQSSFVKGRQGNDNIIVSQGIIQHMRKNKGKKGMVAVKVDLEKAYDRIDWRFLEDTLVDAGLPLRFVQLVMACVTKGEMSVMWNGSLADSFKPSRGIRQGDPISPYLFVLCIERLGHCID